MANRSHTQPTPLGAQPKRSSDFWREAAYQNDKPRRERRYACRWVSVKR
ncbi:MAG: hypothetical protein ACI91F_003476, partial [Candidatus Binatia bacterium]